MQQRYADRAQPAREWRGRAQQFGGRDGVAAALHVQPAVAYARSNRS